MTSFLHHSNRYEQATEIKTYFIRVITDVNRDKHTIESQSLSMPMIQVISLPHFISIVPTCL
jgi:N-formylglutamate amidohydrolase